MSIANKISNYLYTRFGSGKIPKPNAYSVSTRFVNEEKVDAFAGWSYIAMTKLVNGALSLDIFVERKTADGWQVVGDDHWINFLLSNPNNEQKTLKMVMKIALYDYLTTGKAFLYVPFSEENFVPYSILALPSSNMKYKLSDDINSKNLIDSYILDLGAKKYHFASNNVIYLKDLTPTDYLSATVEGTPTMLNASILAILNERERMMYNRKFLKREGTTPYVIVHPEQLDGETAQMQLNMIRENVPKEFEPALFLDSNQSILPLTPSGKDSSGLISDISNDSLIKQISACFGVAMPILTGELMNKDTGRQLLNDFYETAVEPLVEMFCDGLTENLQQYDEDIRVTYSKRREADLDYILRENETYMRLGIKSRNEIRADLEMPSLEDGDTILIQTGFQTIEQLENPPEAFGGGFGFNDFETDDLNTNETDLSDWRNRAKKNETFEREIIVGEDISEIVKHKYWKRYDNVLQSEKNLFVKNLDNIFKDMYREVLKNVDNVKIEKRLKKADIKDDDILDIDKWIKEAQKKMGGDINSMVVRIMEMASRDLGAEFVMSNYEKILAQVAKKSIQKISDGINTFKKTTAEQINRIIEKNPTMSKKELVNKIQEDINSKLEKKISYGRVHAIARTTTTLISGQGQKAVFQENNYSYKWLTQRDGKVRPSHRAADGQEPNSNGLFQIGADRMDTPCGGHLAEENINCRCVLFPIKKS